MLALPRLALAVLAAASAPACMHVTMATRPAPGGELPAAQPRAASAVPTALLTAQVLPPGPSDRDFVLPVRAVVHLTFSRAIDPLTLVPQQFVLALADGRRIAPVGAFLAATGPGTQRSVALLLAERPQAAPGAEPGKPPADPISVTITGLLHDIDGRVLEGLSADVVPRTQPVFPVRAEAVAASHACEGRGQTLRLFWSAPVRPPETGPAPRVVRTSGARSPAEPADATLEAPVQDLCVPGPSGVPGLPDLRSVELPAGAMVDGRGQPSAASALAISPA